MIRLYAAHTPNGRKISVMLEECALPYEIVQRDEDSPLACWAHGIVHLMEGDLPNARYWYGQAKRALPAEASAAAEIKALKGALGAEK